MSTTHLDGEGDSGAYTGDTLAKVIVLYIQINQRRNTRRRMCDLQVLLCHSLVFKDSRLRALGQRQARQQLIQKVPPARGHTRKPLILHIISNKKNIVKKFCE